MPQFRDIPKNVSPFPLAAKINLKARWRELRDVNDPVTNIGNETRNREGRWNGEWGEKKEEEEEEEALAIVNTKVIRT